MNPPLGNLSLVLISLPAAASAAIVNFPDIIVTPGDFASGPPNNVFASGLSSNVIGGADFGTYRLSTPITGSISSGDEFVMTFRPEPGSRFQIGPDATNIVIYFNLGDGNGGGTFGYADLTPVDPSSPVTLLNAAYASGGAPQNVPLDADLLGGSTSALPLVQASIRDGFNGAEDNLSLIAGTASQQTPFSSPRTETISFDAIEIRMSVSNGFVNNLFSPGRTDLGPGTWTLEEDPFRVALYSTTNGGPNGFSVVSVVPEPSASLLGLGGLIALAARRRR